MLNDVPELRRSSTSKAPGGGPVDELDDEAVTARLRRVRRRRQWKDRLLKGVAYGLLAAFGLSVLLSVGYLQPQSKNTRPTAGAAYTGLGGGQVSLAGPAFCGNPLVVFEHFGLADKSGHVGLLDGNGKVQQPVALPSANQLSQLPSKIDQGTAYPISYDPAANSLCATSYVALYTRYVKPQPTVQGSNNYDPNAGFTNQTVSNTLDPGNWVQSALQSLIVNLTHGFYTLLINLRDQLTSFGFMYSTPPPLTYTNGMVTAGFGWSLLALDTAVGLMVVVAGYNMILHRHLDIPAGEVLQIAPRFILALAAAHASMFFIGPLIDLMNTLTGDFLNTVGGAKIVQPVQSWQSITGAAGQLWQMIVTVFFSIIDLIFTLLLILQMLVRIALLDLLIIMAPFWLASTALPQTRSFAQLGASTFVAVLIVQFIQDATVALGSGLAANVLKGSPIVGLLVGVAAFYLAFKIPGMLGRGLQGSMGAVHRDMMVLGASVSGASAAGAAATAGVPPALWVI